MATSLYKSHVGASAGGRKERAVLTFALSKVRDTTLSVVVTSLWHVGLFLEAHEVEHEDGEDRSDVPDEWQAIDEVPPRDHIWHKTHINIVSEAELVNEAQGVRNDEGGEEDSESLHLTSHLLLEVGQHVVDQDCVGANQTDR